MMSIHACLLAASLCALVLAGTAGRRVERIAGRRHAGPALAIVGGALAVGNGVCLLPDAPRWYSIGVIVLSAAALVFLLVGAHPSARTTSTRASGRRHMPLYAIASPTEEPRDAVIVEDHDFRPDNVVSIVREHERTIVTQPMIHAAGPTHGHTTVGQGTYVAANLLNYLPDGSRRRGRGGFQARSHSPVTSDDAAKKLRVVRAYGASGDLRGRLSEHRA